MATVYRLNADGSSEEMSAVRCGDEVKELQDILEKNLDLIPGDQIRPDDARRWLLVKREMNVPDPASGQNRWNIDFMLLDQSAIPTFVECKRHDDTRSRREVIAQMLDYAANGARFWSADELRDAASKAAPVSIEQALQDLGVDDGLDVENFFRRANENLRAGQVRLVFFLEQAPDQLKSIVEFLNRQMERTEVLIVEARQFEIDGMRIVSPLLYGYTEQARAVKRVVVSSPVRARRVWNGDVFFAEVDSRLDPSTAAAIRNIYTAVVDHGFDINWGTGGTKGLFGVRLDSILPNKALFGLAVDGQMALNLGWTNGTEAADRFRELFYRFIVDELKWPLPDEPKFPNVAAATWVPSAQLFLNGFLRLAEMVTTELKESSP